MTAIFASHFASEVTAVTENGGVALLRERAAALDHNQRRMLHQALAERVEV
jgi:hypothetical protein